MKIGIPIQNLEETTGVKTDYLYLVEDMGHTPVIIDPGFELPKFDGLLLPGGTDVDSKRYQPLLPRWNCFRPDKYLEYFDTKILPGFIRKDFPIFGICRGLQTLNVHFGGTLYRDIVGHPTSKSKYDLCHSITFTGDGSTDVANSFHHQAIRILAENLQVLAMSEDGFIEAIRHKEFPIYAVQWHPERDAGDKFSRRILKELFA